MSAPADFLSVEYETVQVARDPETGRPAAARVKRWLSPADCVAWAAPPEAEQRRLLELPPQATTLLARAGKLREGSAGWLVPAGAVDELAAVRRLERVLSDAELEALNARLLADWQAGQAALRPCCPDCFSLRLRPHAGAWRCGCGWQGQAEELHRRAV